MKLQRLYTFIIRPICVIDMPIHSGNTMTAAAGKT